MNNGTQTKMSFSEERDPMLPIVREKNREPRLWHAVDNFFGFHLGLFYNPSQITKLLLWYISSIFNKGENWYS